MINNSAALSKLTNLYSYISRDNFAASGMQDMLPQLGSSLLGVYVNAPDNAILITTSGLHWLVNGEWNVISYRQIRFVQSAEGYDGRFALKLKLEGGTIAEVPVLNSTEDVPDIWSFSDFLFAMIFAPHVSVNSESLREIDSAQSLAEFLEQQESDDNMRYQDLRRALVAGFPSQWQLESLGISRDILDNPSIWRLLGLFHMIGRDS
ncbi:MAG: hypothetical protein IPP57_03000 [Candidatus Obscuribacter sp.]|jgi:hypothetical protein|nr:hypothetical protein [Candidatus Obscuribacter sp.]MDQ5965298.1 hypothetical protein [Cyanobacteriota bacterium erpe_2018_sw_39hr_WHONDRS-SW48-000098_B_bin.30]MBK7839708.1 hypothetical protein [Candidatus Obscuribacter sp.]MBK9202409.1 hypothetical protein [Candidatus Obscuribacter sp.]MBK9618800.1 hypothetical protein [Candidatus Obscuribacter sp.]